jgi:hypothetical protein
MYILKVKDLINISIFMNEIKLFNLFDNDNLNEHYIIILNEIQKEYFIDNL